MLRPSKHESLRTSAVNLGAVVLQVVSSQEQASMDDLIDAIERRCGSVRLARIQEVLTALFAIGAIDYLDETDAFYLSAGRSRLH